jgi:hypothetical protein
MKKLLLVIFILIYSNGYCFPTGDVYRLGCYNIENKFIKTKKAYLFTLEEDGIYHKYRQWYKPYYNKEYNINKFIIISHNNSIYIFNKIDKNYILKMNGIKLLVYIK